MVINPPLYQRHKTLDEIRAQCTAAGIELDESKYEDGGDHVVVRSTGPAGEKAYAVFNTINGTFMGKTPDGVEFNSNDTRHDGQPWFDTLLDFFLMRA